MSKKTIIITISLFILLIVGIVLMVRSKSMSNDSQVPTYLPRPVELVRQDLAEQLDIASSDIEVVQVKTMVWPDTCLGLPAPELCARGETRGFQVILRALGQEYRYHTDRDETFRFAGPGDAPSQQQ